ncbi:MAG: glyoxylate/hydroxypyruvate reductase A [Alphaproteobacteria bacterium]
MPELLFHSAIDAAGPWREKLARMAPDIRLRVWPDDVDDPAAIDCALVWNPPPGLLASLPNLRLIQSLGAGVDGLLSDPRLPDHVPVARLVDGLLTQCMTEYVALHVLYHHRLMPMFARQQAAGIWREEIAPPAQERSVGLMGLGELGTAAAKGLVGLGFRVLGWSRSPHAIDGVAGFHGPDGLAAMLPQCAILVCLLPLTPETEDILDRRLFDRLPRGAALINCARGRHLVEADLLAALDDGRLSGASLDVFRQEPLPAGHPFWTRGDLVITPHMASMANPDSAASLLVENIRRVWAGREPRYRVDPRRGY